MGKKPRWAGHIARMQNSRNAYKILIGKPMGERPLGRSRSKWKGNIKMDFVKVGIERLYWTQLAEVRDQRETFMNMTLNLWVP